MTADDLASAICAFRVSTADAERDDVEEVLALFLRSSLHCPTGPHGQQLPAKLGTKGNWLCVFTGQDLFDLYREAVGATSLTSTVLIGQELVLLARSYPEPTGVLINPSPQRGIGAETSFPVPPETIATLTGNGARYGVFIRLVGETTVQRMTPAGRITDGELFAADLPDEHEAQRAAAKLRQQHPGCNVWIAPL